MELTKWYGEKGLVIDDNFAFASQGNSTDDLIREMNNQGLFVNSLDLTGQVTRVPVNLRLVLDQTKAMSVAVGMLSMS